MKKPPIILASTSPRRKELMEKTGLKFKIVAPDYEEDMSLKLSPKKLAAVLSMGKAMSIVPRHGEAVIISADTFIVFGDRVIGKPKTKKEAEKMLRKFSGKKHSVLTGLALVWKAKNKQFSEVVETKVTFNKLSDSMIKSYLSTDEPMDKAGAYAIQGALAKGLESFGLSIYK